MQEPALRCPRLKNGFGWRIVLGLGDIYRQHGVIRQTKLKSGRRRHAREPGQQSQEHRSRKHSNR